MTKSLSPHCLLVMYALENYKDATVYDVCEMTGLRHNQVFGVMIRLGELEMVEGKWLHLERPTYAENLSAKGRAHLQSLRGVKA